MICLKWFTILVYCIYYNIVKSLINFIWPNDRMLGAACWAGNSTSINLITIKIKTNAGRNKKQINNRIMRIHFKFWRSNVLHLNTSISFNPPSEVSVSEHRICSEHFNVLSTQNGRPELHQKLWSSIIYIYIYSLENHADTYFALQSLT